MLLRKLPGQSRRLLLCLNPAQPLDKTLELARRHGWRASLPGLIVLPLGPDSLADCSAELNCVFLCCSGPAAHQRLMSVTSGARSANLFQDEPRIAHEARRLLCRHLRNSILTSSRETVLAQVSPLPFRARELHDLLNLGYLPTAGSCRVLEEGARRGSTCRLYAEAS